MRIIGYGIDVVRVSAIRHQLDSPEKGWVERVCSNAERALADSPPVDARFYAGRFAAKEAVAKALGTGFAGEITWRGIEILRRETGAPYVRLNDATLALATDLGVSGWHVSISHSGELSTASAIAVGE